MGTTQSNSALATLICWIDARLSTVPWGAPFGALLPRAPFRDNDAGSETADLPVLRFWPAALPDDAIPLTSAAAGALRSLASLLRWRQNPNYRAAPPGPDFLANYGYAEIVGPTGLVAAPGISLGILILGPHTLYPAHRHPAEEIYLPLRPAYWHRGETGPWQLQPAGAVIHHPPMLAHAMRTGDGALPALYLWRGDLETAARLDKSED